MSLDRRYLGSWVLPSGNSCDVYWARDVIEAQWDREPSSDWPQEDVTHWRTVTFPEVLRAIHYVTGLRILGVSR